MKKEILEILLENDLRSRQCALKGWYLSALVLLKNGGGDVLNHARSFLR